MKETERVDVLLIGGGVASVRCARTLRRLGFGGSIVLVGDEPTPPYNRPPLSKELLRDDLPDELALAEPESWYARRNVDLRPGKEVTELDAAGRTARLADGTRIAFERCLLATGAEPRPLTIPGGERALLLRTLSDARQLRQTALAAGIGSPAVVVGGGLIGVEVASGLAALGLRPTVVELGTAVWGGSMGGLLSEWAAGRLRAAGVELRLETAVTEIDDAFATLGDERVPAAFVVAGIGVTPRVGVALRAGLQVDDGIVVDRAQRTSHPAVWAAGDVARSGARRVEHWHAAREGGDRAARSMLAADLAPSPPPWIFTEVAGETVDVFGAPRSWDDEQWIGDSTLVSTRAGHVVQLAAIGGSIPAEQARALVAAAATPEAVLAVVAGASDGRSAGRASPAGRLTLGGP